MRNAKKFRAIYHMNCRTGCRSSEKIWSMKVVLQSHGETLRPRIKILPVLLMKYQRSREQKWNRARVSTVSLLTPKDPNCGFCLRTKITRAYFRRRTVTVVPRAGNFGDLITADHKVLSEGCESRNNHRYAVVVQDLATQWLQSYPCKTKTYHKTQKSLQKLLEPTRKPKSPTIPLNLASPVKNYPGIVVRQHRTDRKRMGLLREQCAESRKGHLRYCCAIRSGRKMVGGFHGMLLLSAKHSRSLVWWEDTS